MRKKLFVYLVRVPILFPFWVFIIIGDGARWAFDRIGEHLPGLEGFE